MAPSIPERVVELLGRPQLGFLSTVRSDGELSVVPVSPMFDGEAVWVSSLKQSRKVRNLTADPRASICVVDRDNPLRYALFRGQADVLPDPDRVKVNEMARLYMDLDEYPYDRPGDERVVIRIRATAVSSPRVHGT
jgi:PPOX class probable F420-dependent enzyme